MATTCGPFTFICVFIFAIIAVHFRAASSLKPDSGATYGVVPRDLRRRGHERVAVDWASSQRRQAARGRGNRGRNSQGEKGVFSKQQAKLINSLSSASASFTLSLYSELRQQNSSGIIFSPLSVHAALTMTYLGARKRTAAEMMRLLDIAKLRKTKAHSAYAALTQSLLMPSSVQLNVANAVFVKPNLPVEEAFRQGLEQMYRAEFDHFNFSATGGPEGPINAWVGNATKGKIPTLLSPGTVTPLTAMIIVNAVYFKGSWQRKFDPELTTEQPFYLVDGRTVPVAMMKQTDLFSYKRSTNLQAQILELPYQDQRFSMFIVLPFARGTLSQVEQSLKLAEITSDLSSMHKVRVNVMLPRFKSKSSFSLKEPLQRLGMSNAFNPERANFRGISSVHQLHISDVIHQAMVEVNEEGAEAAAATGVVITLRSFPISFTADHPFLYVLRDNVSRIVLFMGRYSGGV